MSTRRMFDFTWKCQDCGMSGRKEPHRKLAAHMEATHQKRWSDVDQKYVPIEDVNEPGEGSK